MNKLFLLRGSFFYLPVDTEYKGPQTVGGQGRIPNRAGDPSSPTGGSFEQTSRGLLDILSKFALSVGKFHCCTLVRTSSKTTIRVCRNTKVLLVFTSELRLFKTRRPATTGIFCAFPIWQWCNFKRWERFLLEKKHSFFISNFSNVRNFLIFLPKNLMIRAEKTFLRNNTIWYAF